MNNSLPLLALLPLATLAAACARPAPATPARAEPPARRGFIVMIAEQDPDTIAKTPPAKLGPPILAVSSADPTNANDQALSTSDGHYAIKVHWREKGVDEKHIPCLDVSVSRRAKHPLPDADMRGCIVPKDGEVWLGEIASDQGKSLRAAITFLPANVKFVGPAHPLTAAVQDSSSAPSDDPHR